MCLAYVMDIVLRLLFILLYISLLHCDLFLIFSFCNKDQGYTVKKNCFMIMRDKGVVLSKVLGKWNRFLN